MRDPGVRTRTPNPGDTETNCAGNERNGRSAPPGCVDRATDDITSMHRNVKSELFNKTTNAPAASASRSREPKVAARHEITSADISPITPSREAGEAPLMDLAATYSSVRSHIASQNRQHKGLWQLGRATLSDLQGMRDDKDVFGFEQMYEMMNEELAKAGAETLPALEGS